MRIEDISQIALYTFVVLIFYVPIFIALMKKHSHRIAILSINFVGGIALWHTIAGWMALKESNTLVEINIRMFLLVAAGAAICWLVSLIWCFVDPKKSKTISAVSDSGETDDEKNAGSK